MARKQPSQGRAAATVDAIVTAVERILEREGPKGLTTNRVAEIAGVSVGTLYQYFPNKEALIGALSERYIQQTFAMCRAALAAADGVPLARIIEAVGAALIAAQREQRPIHRWLMDLRTAAAYQDRWRQAISAYVDEVAVFLQARPDAYVVDAKAAAFVLVHGAAGIVEAVGVHHASVDVEALAREGARMLRRYTVRSPEDA